MPVTVTVTASVILLASLILWGVGRIILRYCRVTADIDLLAIGVGLSAVITVGGILNALQLAYAQALWCLIGIGGVVAVRELRNVSFEIARLRSMPLPVIAATLLIVAAALFAIVTQVPPRGLNHFDDLEKYFAHPVRMLATGTLSGSPLNSLGLSTFGGQAFLQAFVLSLLPIQYINAVDAVFGLVVLAGIGAAIGWRLSPGSIAVVAVPLTVLAIDPQYVNSSGVYLPCILMLSAFLLVSVNNPHAGAALPMLLGVVYASLVALKFTFALFALVHCSLALIVVSVATRSWRQWALWVLRVALGALAAILPWLVTFRREYAQWGVNRMAETLSGAGPVPDLLSTAPVYLGATYASYSLVAAVCALAALHCLRKAYGRSSPDQTLLLGVFAAATTGPLCYLVVILVLGPRVLGYETALRYSIPILTAAIIPALGVLPLVFPRLPRAAAQGYAAAACLVIVMQFASSTVGRYSQAWNYGSILAFPNARNPGFLQYIDSALSDQARDRVRSLQAQVPPSEPLLAWIATPFHLDYARNPIIDTVPAGLIAPWAQVPRDVHYVLWQHRGFGVRQPGNYEAAMAGSDLLIQLDAKKGYAFAKRLFQLWIWSNTGSQARIVARDDEFVLFAIERMPD